MPSGDSDLRDSGSSGGSEDDDGDLGLLQGEDAIASLALLLAQSLRSDKSLSRYSNIKDLPAFVQQVQRFLSGIFEGTWPAMFVTRDIVDCPQYDGLVNVILDVARKPLPEGRDVLVSAMTIVNDEKMKERRVQRFHDRVREFVAPDDEEERLGNIGRAQSSTTDGTTDASTDQDDLTSFLKDYPLNKESLELLELPEEIVFETRKGWEAFLAFARTRENAGELVYTALFDAAPSLQALFHTPRAVQALRFIAMLSSFVAVLDDPESLKVQVESLAFQHLDLEATEPRVIIFRKALLDMLLSEVGSQLTPGAKKGICSLLTYTGGAIIFCKDKYASRVKLVLESWATATANSNKGNNQDNQYDVGQAEERGRQSGEVAPPEHQRKSIFRRLLSRGSSHGSERLASDDAKMDNVDATGSTSPRSAASEDINPAEAAAQKMLGKAQYLPQTFGEMFEMNASVSGLRNLTWHREVLDVWDKLVKNVANSYRLQEECDTLTLKISKRVERSNLEVKLSEFKSCLLAALRSMLPKVWDSNYEVAWSWVWENVSHLLEKNLSSPRRWQRAIEGTYASIDEVTMYSMRMQIYDRFFELCPAGQDYFKQSNTRLHYIATKVIEMTLEIIQDPWGTVEEISALGLRHVGYGVPTEHIPHFVTAAVEIFRQSTDDKDTKEGFRWALGLISKILVRTILEGSTIVMKAVNANSGRLIMKALSCAPRAKRAEWVLNIQVGTQQISPLYWSISVGNLDAAQAIFTDLLTLRADRERYYYGVDALFHRHEDIVRILVDEAKSLLPVLFDGLIWRSRHSVEGFRRVNYYIKHLIVGSDGGFADGLKSLTGSGDQTLVSHPVICLVSDTLWSGVVKRSFILAKAGFLFSLFVFMLSQSILPKFDTTDRSVNIAILAGRFVNYGFSMTRMVVSHARRFSKAYRTGDVVYLHRIPIPRYLKGFYLALGFALMWLLITMAALEPMLWCVTSPDWPTVSCEVSQPVETPYKLCSMGAMLIHWLLLIDMAVFSNKLSAFVLVVRYVLSEVGRFAFAMGFLLITFGSGMTVLRHEKREFQTVPTAASCLLSITVGLYEGDFREYFDAPWLLLSIFLFTTTAGILLINLLIAQLNCSYDFVYADMVGFARMTRCRLIVETLSSCTQLRWSRFTTGLKLDQRVEFDEGDIGLPGAIQVKEPASLNPVTTDQIIRFGGACAGDMQWPSDGILEDEDRFEKIERLMVSTFAKLTKLDKKAAGSDKDAHSPNHSGD